MQEDRETAGVEQEDGGGDGGLEDKEGDRVRRDGMNG